METGYRKPLKLEDNEFYRSKPESFQLCHRLLEWTFGFPKGGCITWQGPYIPMVCGLFEQSRSAFEAILVLCNRGYAVQSFPLCRQLFEALLNVRFLQKDKSRAERLRRYTRYRHLLHGRGLPSLPRSTPFSAFQATQPPWSDEEEKELRELEDKLSSRFKFRWSGLSMKKMACKVGTSADFEALYPFLSGYVHLIDPFFFGSECEEGNTIRVRSVPSFEGISDAHLISFYCFAQLTKEWLEVIGELDKKVEEEFQTLLSLNPASIPQAQVETTWATTGWAM